MDDVADGLVGFVVCGFQLAVGPGVVVGLVVEEAVCEGTAYTGIEHISDHDLESYHLGMVLDETELAPVEEHLLACPSCAERAEQAAEYIDTLRGAIIAGNFDLD